MDRLTLHLKLFVAWARECPAPLEVLTLVVFLELLLCQALLNCFEGLRRPKRWQQTLPVSPQFVPSTPQAAEAAAKESKCWSDVANSQKVSLIELKSLRDLYRLSYRTSYSKQYPTIGQDPYLPCQEDDEIVEACLLGRFLRAVYNEKAKDPVAAAMGRMDEVLAFRSEYRCDLFHTQPQYGSKMFKQSESGQEGVKRRCASTCEARIGRRGRL